MLTKKMSWMASDVNGVDCYHSMTGKRSDYFSPHSTIRSLQVEEKEVMKEGEEVMKEVEAVANQHLNGYHYGYLLPCPKPHQDR